MRYYCFEAPILNKKNISILNMFVIIKIWIKPQDGLKKVPE